ncbi:hypothetical protein [Pedomonas mirosovicensis]|uniref:hypothetical protein n=1 Tax=Pedomonas mirosovicensis TaxID=2908641 RepID=UPI0021683064|nr:hypothetical protein [Pedomonas mirosovicensis]MCH8686256.1 hypothetical protein [Pedomonas mirosovicensis]
MKTKPDPRRQWTWPIALAALTIVGLVAALLGEGGLWWPASWIALSLPLIVALRHALRPARSPDARQARAQRDHAA